VKKKNHKHENLLLMYSVYMRSLIMMDDVHIVDDVDDDDRTDDGS